MREILDACVRIDELANVIYLDLQRRCSDPEIAALMGQMAVEETQHVAWWNELLDAWNAGLLPDVSSGSEEALHSLAEMIEDMRSIPVGTDAPVDVETALTTAARIEFFALAPTFSELLDLAEPGVGRRRHDAYTHHVDRIVEAFERTFAPNTLAGLMTHVLRRAQHDNRVMSRYSTHDPLTGLGNRRQLAVQVTQWAAWASRYGNPLSVLLVDVDNFKDINDTHGHLIGDRVLMGVAAAISSTVRAADLASRYGGDEFAIVAPELEPAGARVLAERLQTAVRPVRITGANGVPITPTVSIGIVTVFDPPDSEPRSADELLAAADRSLYAAKQAGRDRVADPVVLAREMVQ
jgi:diguanylate cyclase (GGDEF)-like protein